MTLFSPFADRPAAPQQLTVTDASQNSVSLTWRPSPSDGGSPVVEYVIEKRDASHNNWIGVGRVEPDKHAFTAGKLWEGCDYFFRVAAENKVGASDYATLDEAVTARLPYCKSHDSHP